MQAAAYPANHLTAEKELERQQERDWLRIEATRELSSYAESPLPVIRGAAWHDPDHRGMSPPSSRTFGEHDHRVREKVSGDRPERWPRAEPIDGQYRSRAEISSLPEVR